MSTSRTMSLESLTLGDTLYHETVAVSREGLVRYAGASGDFNPIHYNDTAAQSSGLPGVIAHGMLTMGYAVAPLANRLAPDIRIASYGTRFTNPIVVPADGSVNLTLTATVGHIDRENGSARIDIVATVDGTAVLGRARAQLVRRQAGEQS